MLTFRSGGWVILAAGIMTAALLVWALAGALIRTGGPLVGDGRTVSSYGFDLATCLVDRDLLVAGRMRKDALRSLENPPVIPGTEVARINEEERGKYLVTSDRVIGVVVEGEARGYPIQMLNAHEIINDTLGGVPIAVTYNPLCDAAAVFDRRVAGETLEFGVSGLLYNSNLVMYDRRAPEGNGASGRSESLWSQLQARAIAGPAAERGDRLQSLPCALIGWGEWLSLHPQTTVPDRDHRLARRYQQTPYALYFLSDEIRFPVRPQPPAGGPGLKERVIAVTTPQGTRAYTFATIADGAGPDGIFRDTVGDTQLSFYFRAQPETVWVSADPPEAIESVVYAFWFAWHAMGGTID
jgi:hypothetical protein